jgi:hypothetical protein
MKKMNLKILEKYIFILIVLLNLIPILSGKFFPTVDGPAHLYNAKLITYLLFENHANLETFFSFNSEPVPNWTGHLILTFFSSFLPGFLAEKMMLLLYMIGFPFAFRALVRTIAPQHIWSSYLIFPFTYSLVFFFGFYNFSFSLIFLLITLNYWIKHDTRGFTKKSVFILFLLILASYFSHIFVFGILLFSIGLHIGHKAIFQWMEKQQFVRTIFIDALKKAGILLIASGLPLILFAQYFLLRPNLHQDVFYETHVLIDWLKNMRPIIALHFDNEENYTKILAWLYLALTIIALFIWLNGLRKAFGASQSMRHVLIKSTKSSGFWLLAALFMLFLYFKLPESDGYGGFISIRLGMLFFLFYALWLATQKMPVFIGVLAALIVLFCNFKLNFFYLEETRKHNQIAVECHRAADFIEPNSIVLPIDASDDWFDIHLSNYLGVDKAMVILENYECNHGYFPLVWNKQKMPTTVLGTLTPDDLPCVHLKHGFSSATKSVDYVFVLGDLRTENDCHNKIQNVINEQFSLVYSTENCALFRLNEKELVRE